MINTKYVPEWHDIRLLQNLGNTNNVSLGNDQLRIHRSLSPNFICIFLPSGQICGQSNSEPAGDQLSEQ